jgi:hypothetical protein
LQLNLHAEAFYLLYYYDEDACMLRNERSGFGAAFLNASANFSGFLQSLNEHHRTFCCTADKFNDHGPKLIFGQTFHPLRRDETSPALLLLSISHPAEGFRKSADRREGAIRAIVFMLFIALLSSIASC